MVQRPTCSQLRVRSPADAQVIFHAVRLQLLPMVTRRLDTEERRAIKSGSVFVWEERGPNSEATGLGIERWTDGIRWGPSRVRDEFLFYHEKTDTAEVDTASDTSDKHPRRRPVVSQGIDRDNIIKQTYSVWVNTARGQRKWHLIAYFTQDSIDRLRSIDNVPQLASLRVPPGEYKSARAVKGSRAREESRRESAVPAWAFGVQRAYGEPPEPPVDYAASNAHRIDQPFHPNYPQTSKSSPTSASLAPLAYLRRLPPPRRHPLDEKALMQFSL
ncbi:hypothetical protein PLICRDRAFT_37436 [Plicaturopsis crispa FD-325 SS-3]|nr:hypothetical protein PLICRDRAFT_37436 [Plicaturopsis crispa FD-325 SS-3]